MECIDIFYDRLSLFMTHDAERKVYYSNEYKTVVYGKMVRNTNTNRIRDMMKYTKPPEEFEEAVQHSSYFVRSTTVRPQFYSIWKHYPGYKLLFMVLSADHSMAVSIDKGDPSINKKEEIWFYNPSGG